MKNPQRVVALIAVLFLSIYALKLSAHERSKTSDDEDALLKTDTEFAKASIAKGAAEAFSMYLADDAMQLPAGGNPVFGKRAILAGMGSGYLLTWEPKKAEAARSGDLGWTWGTYELHTKDSEGKLVVHYGKYVNVWRKQKDGAWRVVVDMGNASPPPAAQVIKHTLSY
jgi:ketosteroid isomerase-like protein